jgi:aminodeoxyfutalosine synthase
MEDYTFLIEKATATDAVKAIAAKVMAGERITIDDALLLYNEAETALLGLLASHVRMMKNGRNVFFIRNIHVEPTNICVYSCRFCSYSKKAGEQGAWSLSAAAIVDRVRKLGGEISELHITGGAHPKQDLDYYCELFASIKEVWPRLHIKALSAVELFYLFKLEGISYEEGLRRLSDSGLNSLPGGGAEIFDEELRKQICPDKVSSADWLAIHEAAHKLGMHTNATMLYGHLESYEHRIDHMNRLREMQDRTNMFNAFIPLEYKSRNNSMDDIKECTLTEDLRNYAIARIFLDNIPHLKAYWPMTGKQQAQLALSFGVDDMDGTINASTSIYSAAGGDSNPSMSTEEIIQLAGEAGFTAVERDAYYKVI